GLGDGDGSARHAGETEQAGNQANDQENDRPSQHGSLRYFEILRRRNTEYVAPVPATIFLRRRNYCGAVFSPARVVPRVASCSNCSAGLPGEAVDEGSWVTGKGAVRVQLTIWVT